MGKYRNESNRYPGWNYGWDGFYFVTICVKHRAPAFGQVVDGRMELSELGQWARYCWKDIPNHFPFVVLDAFIVMPDHIHGIIQINKPVGAQDFAPLRARNIFGPQSQNLGSIIRGFKIGVKKYTTMHHIPFQWQPNYHDHIIRNQQALERIRIYIRNNPKNWKHTNT